MNRKTVFLVLLIVFAMSVQIQASSPSKMYWANYHHGKISRANLDGSEVEDIVTGVDLPSDVAVDLEGGKVYWSATSWGPGKIQRANLDGSEIEDIVSTGLLGPIGIDIDNINKHVYWIDPYTNKIQRANLDGSQVTDVVVIPGGFTYPYDIALDVARGQIYWTDWGTDRIQRANLDGSEMEDLITTGMWYPCGIAIDSGAGKMYWTDYGTDDVKRANLDGSAVEQLVSGLDEPTGIDLDPADGKMYIVDYGTGKILLANLDGSGVQQLVTGLGGPWDIDLGIVPEPTNLPPVADAGRDQVIYACAVEVALVTLDGSGSYDADGDELEYFWFEGPDQIATGIDPNVLLGVGENWIELIVDDGTQSSEPNDVVITVIGPIEADVHIVPRTINRQNRMKRIMAIIRLPEGISKHDIADEPFVLEPGGIEAIWDRVIGRGNKATVFALFDKNEVMAQLPDTGGVELTVTGKLKSGQCIYGRDTVRIIRPRQRSRLRIRR